MASLLFVGHEASLTGAPYIQLYTIQWLRAHTDHTIELVLLRGGALKSEFEKVANVHIVNEYIESPTIKQRISRKLVHLTNAKMLQITRRVKKANPKLIYANTALTLEFAAKFKDALRIPLINNIHELDSMFFYNDVNVFGESMKKIDFFIPASNAVKQLYQSLFNVPDSITEVVYDFTNDVLNGSSTGTQIRERFGISNEIKIVGAVGRLGWQKGPDLFLQVAHYLMKSSNEKTCFMWLGCNKASIQFKEIEHDLRLMGLEGRVLFIAAEADVRGYFEAFDVFVLTSREDPFPLVCMEAAMAGCPIVCFANAGGMPEFVREDAGFVVPYGDIQAMGDKVAYLLANDSTRDALGKTGQKRAVENHTIKSIGPKVNQIIEKFL